MRRLALLVLLLVPIISCTGPAPVQNHPRIHNVIYVIGDGIGPAHLAALRIANGDSPIAAERMSSSAMLFTSCANDLITDSAAAITALACGTKTNYRMLGVDPEGNPVESAMEIAKRRGMATGLVTTSYMVDATPAGFVAHVPDRHMEPIVARQMIEAGVDLMIGSGEEHFETPPNQSTTTTALDLAKEKGIAILEGREALESATATPFIAFFPGEEGDADFAGAPLPWLMKKSLDLLSKHEQGFFLVVEHEGTDSLSHDNETDRVLASLRSLDEALSAALDFADRDGNTLVLFAGDHETGGLVLKDTGDPEAIDLHWTSTGHTATPVPFFADGPFANRFRGLQSNVQAGATLKAIMAAAPENP